MIIEEYTRRQAPALDELIAHGNAPALMIDYDEALADPDGTVLRIAEHIDLPVTATATAFVSPKLRRHRADQPTDTLRNADQGLTTLTM